LTKDPDDGVRYDAAIALGILGDSRGVGPLVQLVATSDPAFCVYGAASEGLYRLGKAAVPALIKLLRHRDAGVKYEAGSALGHMQEESAIEPLAAMLLSPDAQTRLAGVDALGRFDSSQCLDLVKTCIADPDETVRSEAEFWASGGFGAVTSA